jgi:hypothetical protein
MSCSPRSEEHLNADYHEDRRHGYEAWHSRIAIVPEVREAWVVEGLEGGRQEMDEGCCYENACAEVSRYEEELVGNWYRGKALDDNWEGASYDRQSCIGRRELRYAYQQYSG